MDCRTCGVDLPRDAVYCLRCGARVELGSVLGVGTDLPPHDRAEPAGEQDLSETAVLPRIPAPSQPQSQQSQSQARPAQPMQPAAAAATPAPAGTSGHSRGMILAMVAAFAVLTIIGTFALTRIVGSDGSDGPETAATPTTSTEEGQDSSQSPTAPDASASTQQLPSPTTVPTESGPVIPAGARRCSTTGSDAVATAYAATERTSCEFAASVREAYRKAGTPDGATTLRAYSPVTKKWYSLSCDGGAPVRCTSTTNAVVLLAP